MRPKGRGVNVHVYIHRFLAFLDNCGESKLTVRLQADFFVENVVFQADGRREIGPILRACVWVLTGRILRRLRN